MKGLAVPNSAEEEALRERFAASPAHLRESLCAYVSRNYITIERELCGGRTTAQLAADLASVRNEKVSLTNLRTYLAKLRKKYPNLRAQLENHRFLDPAIDNHRGLLPEGRRLPPSSLSKTSENAPPSAAEIARENQALPPIARTYTRLK
jgi:hypothetical protein